jgi:hypothetical protein|eukprot:Stramenopile-MAST_4_protein_2363
MKPDGTARQVWPCALETDDTQQVEYVTSPTLASPTDGRWSGSSPVGTARDDKLERSVTLPSLTLHEVEHTGAPHMVESSSAPALTLKNELDTRSDGKLFSPSELKKNAPPLLKFKADDEASLFKKNVQTLPSMYLTEWLPFIKTTKWDDVTVNVEYHPPRTSLPGKRLRPMTKHTLKRKKQNKSEEVLKVNRMIKNELKPLKQKTKAQSHERQRRWIFLVRMSTICKTILRSIHETKLNTMTAFEHEKAANIIQNNYRKHYYKRMGDITRHMHKNYFFLLIWIRIQMRAKVRRKKARILRWFCGKFGHFTRVNVAVKVYRYAVIKAQRLVRKWLACKGARLEVLCRKWSRIEYAYRFKLRKLITKVQAQLKRQEENDTSLLTLARKIAAEDKLINSKFSSNMAPKKLKKNSVLLSLLQDEIAPILQDVREVMGNKCLTKNGLRMVGTLAKNPSALSKDGNPKVKKSCVTGNTDTRTKNASAKVLLSRIRPAALKELTGNNSGLNAGSVVPLGIRLVVLQRYLMKARKMYILQGADKEEANLVSSVFDAGDMQRMLSAGNLSVEDLLSSKKATKGMFKPYTSACFNHKEMRRIIKKTIEDVAHASYYET